MSGPTVTQCPIETAAGTLYGTLYTPIGDVGGGVVFCNPLFEERKSANQPMAGTARELASRGIAALRFDYRGCGDSPGEFRSFTPSHWLEDIRCAVELLRRRCADAPVGLLGLRIGASLALEAAVADGACALVVLWEPVVSGGKYLEQELRKKLMKEMMTFGEGQSTRDALLADLAAGKEIDFDGYPLSAALYAELQELDLAATAELSMLRTYVLQVSPSPKLAEPLRRLCEGLAKKGRVESDVVRAPPFWNLVGIVDCPDVIGKTCAWVTRALGTADLPPDP